MAEPVTKSGDRPVETRYYIGLTGLYGGTRLSLKAGPGRPEDFKTPPHQPVLLGDGTEVFPVSEAVWREWHPVVDEDDSYVLNLSGKDDELGDRPGPDAARWTSGIGQ